MKDIVIVGSGGFAKEVAFLIDEINSVSEEWNFLGYIDQGVGSFNGKYTVFQNDGWLLNTFEKIHVVFGIGNPLVISRLYKMFSANTNLFFPNLVHPNVIGDWKRIKMGKGNIICASNVFTTDIFIGNFNVFNLDCTIGHDVVIGNYNVINPSVNISGGVQLSDRILLGTNATLLQYLSVCADTVIGANALVNKSIETSGTYIGSPAKQLLK